MIIDCHGHYTTAPAALGEWRDRQIAGLKNQLPPPTRHDLSISDDEIRVSIDANQLRLMDERGIDLTDLLSAGLLHGPSRRRLRDVSAVGGNLQRVVFPRQPAVPGRFAPAAMLPQSPGVDPATCVPELIRCVEEYGAVAINLNPDPSGGHWTAPPLTDRSWYPIYEKMAEYDIPAMVHVSTSVNPAFHTTGAHYLNADTTALMQLIEGDLFADFPTLRLVIPHGGGAVPYHWGRFRGLAMALKKPPLEEHILDNVFFDTCVYHQPGIDLLLEVIPRRNILFASEMIGAVRDIDPCSGHHFDDTRRYIDHAQLDDDERAAIQEGNARAVYPRLNALAPSEIAHGQ